MQLVESMTVRDLTEESFEDFVQGAHGLFVQKGARFQEYFSPGYNDSSKDGYEWSNGKPEYRSDSVLVFERIEPKELKDQGQKWINVHFRNETYNFENAGVWGYAHDRLPLKFGFDQGKALYIGEQSGNGTTQQPWETLYLKLK